MPRTKGVLPLTAAICGAAAALTTLTGCSDDGTPSSVSSAASSLASQASKALASATAEAGRKLDEIKGGVDATSDVKAGTPGKDTDGRATVEVTATNATDATKSYAVQVDFKDGQGNWLDTVVVTVTDVPAGGTGTGTARSNRDLSGEVKAEVARAVRY